MKYLFYPGCSMQRSAKPYLDSLKLVEKTLGLESVEVEDWNCCGATEFSSVNRTASHAIVGRNLALAQEQVNGSNDLVAACSACYLNLSKTDHFMREDADFKALVNEALGAGGLEYEPGSINVRHSLDVIVNDVGYAAVKEKVTKPLTGLRVGAYYGCMIVRPDVNKRFSDPEDPFELEDLLETLGAEVVDFKMKTQCCSGHMTQISSEVAYDLIKQIVKPAVEAEIDVLVTLCPMCQLNIDAFQKEMNKHFGTNYKVPILYFSQLMGLAFGYGEKELGIGKEFVNVSPALAKIGKAVSEVPAPKKKRKSKDDPSLPMPKMPVRIKEVPDGK
jgi:heterodisulfide reductase subunit B